MSKNNKKNYELNYTDKKLNDLYTQQLINLKNGVSHMMSYEYDEDWTREDLKVYYNKIKTILDNREHIPNKVEAKAIRQAKAKQKK